MFKQEVLTKDKDNKVKLGLFIISFTDTKWEEILPCAERRGSELGFAWAARRHHYATDKTWLPVGEEVRFSMSKPFGCHS